MTTRRDADAALAALRETVVVAVLRARSAAVAVEADVAQCVEIREDLVVVALFEWIVLVVVALAATER